MRLATDIGARRIVRTGIPPGDGGRARRSRWRGWTVPLPLLWPRAARPPVAATASGDGCIRTPPGLLVTGGPIVTGAGPGTHRGPDHDDWQEPAVAGQRAVLGHGNDGCWPVSARSARATRPAGTSALRQSLRLVSAFTVSSRSKRLALPARICSRSAG